MSLTRFLFVAGLTGIVVLGSLAFVPVSQAAADPHATSDYQDIIRNRRERKARLHAVAEERRMMLERMVAEAMVIEQMQLMEAMRMQQRQSMLQTFWMQSQSSGTWNHCATCGTLVSPSASVGQTCPFCGVRWGVVQPGWPGP
jgi:hypothetical protein